MARKSKTRSTRSTDSSDAAQAIRDSAQKIWLAGLGAFERARTDGPRMFETLVEQGRNMGARAIGAADEALKSARESGFSLGEVVRQMAGADARSSGKRATSRTGTRKAAKGGSRAKAATKARTKASGTRKAAAGSTARRSAAKGTRTRRKRSTAA
jgi:hypothetical protein